MVNSSQKLTYGSGVEVLIINFIEQMMNGAGWDGECSGRQRVYKILK